MTLTYHLTDLFHSTHENPFDEDTRLWHVWVDICTTHGDGPELNIDYMMSHHGMNWDYYTDALEELTECGYLKRVYHIKGA